MTGRAFEPPGNHRRVRSDAPFYAGLLLLSGFYVFLIVAMLVADLTFAGRGEFLRALTAPETRYAIKLSLISCTLATVFSLWVAAPAGYLFSRYRFPGKALFDSILDVPIVLPPLVVGLSLLILFRTAPGIAFETFYERVTGARITYAVAGVVLAQFTVACAFAVRTMRATFDGLSPRREQVALTLGCSRGQAFWLVALPEARKGLVVAATLAWARSLGEFGPILIFAGATRLKTEVLSTTVFLEMSVGNVEAAVAVSLLMIAVSLAVLVIVRVLGFAEYLR
ncbi:MAG: ABC transporter permease [Candidatus Hydrogenedentes bacterium]|nr:ABC transporter permease [Candidatus Hydrogenedentota bacterium]